MQGVMLGSGQHRMLNPRGSGYRCCRRQGARLARGLLGQAVELAGAVLGGPGARGGAEGRQRQCACARAPRQALLVQGSTATARSQGAVAAPQCQCRDPNRQDRQHHNPVAIVGLERYDMMAPKQAMRETEEEEKKTARNKTHKSSHQSISLAAHVRPQQQLLLPLRTRHRRCAGCCRLTDARRRRWRALAATGKKPDRDRK